MKAYPFIHKNPTSGITESAEGMDLRDWFAGLAMGTLIQGRGSANLNAGGYKSVSIMAYLMADAMIKQRENKDE